MRERGAFAGLTKIGLACGPNDKYVVHEVISLARVVLPDQSAAFGRGHQAHQVKKQRKCFFQLKANGGDELNLPN